MAEIIALTEALRRPIAIYHRPAAGGGSITLQDTYGGEQPGLVIPIFYVNGNHYMALQGYYGAAARRGAASASVGAAKAKL